MTDFTDRIVLVTGASRGLGYAAARALGARGAHVIAVARTVGGLEELDDAIGQAGGQVTLVPLDLTDDPALERMGAAIFERWGRLDLWLHTAVDAPSVTPVEHIEARDIDRSWAVTVRATQRLIRVVDPLLRQAPGARAVFFRDPDAEARRYHGCYQMAKTAQLALARSWGDAGASRAAEVIVADAPPMSTAVRGRFQPGLDRAELAPPAEVAARLVAALAGERGDEAAGAWDLSRP